MKKNLLAIAVSLAGLSVTAQHLSITPRNGSSSAEAGSTITLSVSPVVKSTKFAATSQEEGNVRYHVDTAQAHRYHVDTAQVHRYHVDTAQAHRYHVDTAQAHRYHVDTAQAHRYHVDTAQVHRYHVDTAQVHRYRYPVDTSQTHRMIETTTVLFPNPASAAEGFALRYVSENEIPLQVAMYDATGREVRNTKFEAITGSNLIQLPTSELQPGAYLLIIRQGGNLVKKKVMLY